MRNQISFDDCASQLFAYWKKLLEQLTGKLYISELGDRGAVS